MSRHRDTTPPGYQREQWGQGATTPLDPDLTSPPARKRRHMFRWVFLAVQVLFLVWIITGATSGSGTPASCKGLVGEGLKTCQDAGHAGTAIGVGLIIGLWVAVDFIITLTYLVVRRRP